MLVIVMLDPDTLYKAAEVTATAWDRGEDPDTYDLHREALYNWAKSDGKNIAKTPDNVDAQGTKLRRQPARWFGSTWHEHVADILWNRAVKVFDRVCAMDAQDRRAGLVNVSYWWDEERGTIVCRMPEQGQLFEAVLEAGIDANASKNDTVAADERGVMGPDEQPVAQPREDGLVPPFLTQTKKPKPKTAEKAPLQSAPMAHSSGEGPGNIPAQTTDPSQADTRKKQARRGVREACVSPTGVLGSQGTAEPSPLPLPVSGVSSVQSHRSWRYLGVGGMLLLGLALWWMTLGHRTMQRTPATSLSQDTMQQSISISHFVKSRGQRVSSPRIPPPQTWTTYAYEWRTPDSDSRVLLADSESPHPSLFLSERIVLVSLP